MPEEIRRKVEKIGYLIIFAFIVFILSGLFGFFLFSLLGVQYSSKLIFLCFWILYSILDVTLTIISRLLLHMLKVKSLICKILVNFSCNFLGILIADGFMESVSIKLSVMGILALILTVLEYFVDRKK